MRGTAIALLMAFVLPSSFQAQMTRWERQVRDRLALVLSARSAAARTSGIVSVGNLNGEEADTIAIELATGETYEFLAVCDDDCGGVRLVLANQSGSELASTRPDEYLPVLRFTPSRAVAHRLRVVMAACRMNPCWYALGMLRAPAVGPP